MSVRIPGETTPALLDATADIETPAVLVDLDVMERNMAEYAAFANEHDVDLRSHAKTHKIPDIAHQQQELTGCGILCQTLGEAEVMAQSGIDDIYLSYMVVEKNKLDRLVWLSDHLKSFTTTVDCVGNIYPLQQAAERHETTIDVVLELDIGLNRVGVELGEPAVELAKLIVDQSNLDLVGVMAYEGHIGYGSDAPTTEDGFERECIAAMDEVAETVDRIETAGVPIHEVKVGSTATSRYSGKHPVVTEINPGMYPFNDAHLLGAPHVTRNDCALTVLTTVISTPNDDRVVVDAGSKSISLDVEQSPLPKNRDDIEYVNASEEHGWLDASGSNKDITVGDKLEFIVPHVCTTINLHDVLVGVRDNRVEEIWGVQARGKVK